MSADFIYFYGLAPKERNNRCLSQWWPSLFTVDGISYPTAEHFMMSEKARIFGDAATRVRILKAKRPARAKILGRQVKGFDLRVWETTRVEVVFKGNLAKFEQNQPLKSFLIGTGEATLVESSPEDCIWGIGVGSDDSRACDPSQWRGQNLLGIALMKVRTALR